MCRKPTVNGQPGYSWDGKTTGTYPPNPPEMLDGDELLQDEPGRCGGLDSHSYHFRVVRHYGITYLLVRHGAGDERIRLGGCRPALASIAAMDSNARYWMLQLIYHVQHEKAADARLSEQAKWVRAAIDGRIKVSRGRTPKVTLAAEPRPCKQ
jgi:hypothetical protein